MASIYKRKDKKGKTIGWRAVVRMKGYPTVCKQCDRQQEAIDWSTEVEREIKQGRFNVNLYKAQHTFNELLER